LLRTRSGETLSGGNPAASAVPERQHNHSGISFTRVFNPVSRNRIPQS
jgi:hypothetical protein